MPRHSSKSLTGSKAHPDRGRNAWMASYTDEQLAALETMETGDHALRIARAEFANQALLPDGTVSDNLDAVREALTTGVLNSEDVRTKAQAAMMKAQAALKSSKTSNSDEAKAARDEARQALTAANRAGDDARRLQVEFEDHVAEDRFLFVLDESGVPRVYFQCAVQGNPDTPMLKSEHTTAHIRKVRDTVMTAAEKDRQARFAAGTQTEADEEMQHFATRVLKQSGKALGFLIAAMLLTHFAQSPMHALTLVGLAIGAISYKTSTGNYLLDQLYDNKFPAGSLLQIRSGAAAGPDNAAGGSLGDEITLPATPWAAAASKSKAKSGTWSAAATGSITAAHFRLKNAGDTEREEGTVSTSAADLNLDNTSINTGQTVTITTFTRTAA